MSNNEMARKRRSFLGGSYKRKQLLSKAAGFIFRLAFIVGACFLILQPLLMKISVSFMSVKDVYDQTVKVIPKVFTVSNYADAIVITDFWKNLSGSLLLCLIAGVTQTLSCTIVGYGFARFRFKCRDLLFVLVIICMVVPPQLVTVPQLINFSTTKINGGVLPFFFLGITACAARCGLYIYLVRQFFRGIPKEVDEAAAIDGAGPFKTFFLIMLQSAVPIMVTVFLFAFVWQWGENGYTNLFYSGDTLAHMLMNLPSKLGDGLASKAGSISVVPAQDLAAYRDIITSTTTLMCVVPLLVLYLFSQKFFIQSIERTGIVG